MKTFFEALIVIVLIGAGYFYYQSTRVAAPTGASTVQTAAPTELRTTPRSQMSGEQAAKVTVAPLAPELEAVLSAETNILQTVATNPAILSAVHSANDTDKTLTLEQITKLDSDWIASKTVTPFIQQFLGNATAVELLAFQKAHAGFKEVFVTDAYGLNVGQTDKTSDYYQADESWWVNAYNGGAGKALHGKIEFDQSSQAEAISIYVPIMEGSKAIGVIKGVLDLSAVKSQL